ncbi:MAG: HIT domain-containing protein [Verrucomicrobia bacterium]|nr:HIT domain-containing protein [Verrucomicrobiota bacterium]
MDDDFPQQMRAIWAPWRVEYFEQPRPDNNAGGGDFLTAAAQTSDDAAHLVVLRRKSAFLLMNRYPYSNGHLMAVPYRKAADLADLNAEEKSELWTLAEAAQKLLRATVHAQGFNIGLNLGACAGAGVPDHLHLHIVPRWAGDVNFMPVLGATRVIPQGLQPLYEKLIQARGELGL